MIVVRVIGRTRFSLDDSWNPAAGVRDHWWVIYTWTPISKGLATKA